MGGDLHICFVLQDLIALHVLVFILIALYAIPYHTPLNIFNMLVRCQMALPLDTRVSAIAVFAVFFRLLVLILRLSPLLHVHLHLLDQLHDRRGRGSFYPC